MEFELSVSVIDPALAVEPPEPVLLPLPEVELFGPPQAANNMAKPMIKKPNIRLSGFSLSN
jgi:hypothetical protein